MKLFLVSIFVILQILDLISTIVGLKVGCVEQNPIVRVLLNNCGVLGWTIVKLIVSCILIVFCDDIMVIYLDGFYIWVVINNFHEITKVSSHENNGEGM